MLFSLSLPRPRLSCQRIRHRLSLSLLPPLFHLRFFFLLLLYLNDPAPLVLLLFLVPLLLLVPSLLSPTLMNRAAAVSFCSSALPSLDSRPLPDVRMSNTSVDYEGSDDDCRPLTADSDSASENNRVVLLPAPPRARAPRRAKSRSLPPPRARAPRRAKRRRLTSHSDADASAHRGTSSGASQPADDGGASQPADDGGASQPADDDGVKDAAIAVRQRLATLIAEPAVPPDLRVSLSSVLWGTASVENEAGKLVQRAMTSSEIDAHIRRMLEWRAFYIRTYLPQIPRPISPFDLESGMYIFSDKDRQGLMECLRESHRLMPHQLQQRERDRRRGMRNRQVNARQRSRFQLMLKRLPGSKQVSLAIMFTGVVSPRFIEVVQDMHLASQRVAGPSAEIDGASQPVAAPSAEIDGASQPVAAPSAGTNQRGRRKLRAEALNAIAKLRLANTLQRQVDRGRVHEEDLLEYEQELLHHRAHGTLEMERDSAVNAFERARAERRAVPDVVRDIADTWKESTAGPFQ